MKKEILTKCIKDINKISPIYAIYITVNMFLMIGLPLLNIYFLTSIFDNLERMILGYDNSLLIYIIAFLICIILNRIAEIINKYMSDVILGKRINQEFSIKLYNHISKISLDNFESTEFHNKIKYAQNCLDNGSISGLFSIIFLGIPQFFNLIGLVVAVGIYSKWLLLLALISILPCLFANLSANKNYYKIIKFQSEKQRFKDYLWELFFKKESMREMRLHNFSEYLINKWIIVRNEAIDEEITVKGKASKKIFLGDIIKLFSYGVCLCLCIFFSMKKIISINVLGVCFLAFFNLQNTMQMIVMNFSELEKHINFLNDYYSVLSININESKQEKKLKKIETIELDRISYKYKDSENKTCNNITLHIEFNEKVAIVGENGSGKTTLMKIIAGLLEPQSGTVSYNNKNIKSISKSSLFDHMSVIQQNFTKLNTSIKENIEFGRENLTDKELSDILIQCDVEDLLNKNFYGQIGNEFDGYDFSGGQWQKIAICRALVHKSDLIFLDEPTASLDPISERNILKKFIELTENKTAVIISHRLGICKYVDKIIVLKEGEIAEMGNHTQLLALNGVYANMWREQSKWYKDV